MRYIEKEDNITREYDVKINDVELEKIVDELNEKCCRALKKTVNVTGYNKKEAREKIASINKDGINIVSRKEVSEDLANQTKCPYVYECEYFCKQPSYLAYLLNIILKNYRTNRNYILTDDKAMNLLIDYINNDELKPYTERMAEEGITEDLYFEFEYNKDFDFELLYDLYKKALECFSLVLVSETTRYNPYDKNAKTYKIGERK